MSFCVLCVTTALSTTHLTLMKDAVADGAVCLDGTPAGYYYGPAATAENANDWMIHFEGGGWCYDAQDCYDRSHTALGSSNGWGQVADGSGMMSENCTISPEFCNFNHVNLKYCDGNSFAGNADDAMMVKGKRLYFRGKRILDAALASLSSLQNLSKAENVILTGCSAGGLATFLHVERVHDWFKVNAPNLKRFKAAPISGFFLDHDSLYGAPVYEIEMKSVHAFTNASLGGGLNAACVQRYAPSGDDWKCNFAQYTYEFIDTPLFVLNSGLDHWQTKCIMTAELPAGWPNQTGTENGVCGVGSYSACQNAPDTHCNETEIVHMNQYTVDFMATLGNASITKTSGHGAFIHSCHTHCEGQDNNYFRTFTVDGVLMRDAVSAWWNSTGEPTQKHSYAPCLRVTGNVTDRQCNPSCRGTGRWD